MMTFIQVSDPKLSHDIERMLIHRIAEFSDLTKIHAGGGRETGNQFGVA